MQLEVFIEGLLTVKQQEKRQMRHWGCNYLPSRGRSDSHLHYPSPHFRQSIRIEQIGKQSEVYLLSPDLSFQTRAMQLPSKT